MAPRGIRNNNFGNIEDGPFAQSLPGYAGSDGRFAIFNSPQDGLGAHSELLRRYGARGINTLGGVVNRWAPSTDGNNVNAYTGYLASQMGLAPDANIDLNDPELRMQLARHMGAYENGPQAFSAAMNGATDMSARSRTAPPQNLGAFAAPHQQPNGGGLERGLMNAFSSLMAIDNPKGAAVLAAQAGDNDKNKFGLQVLPDGRIVRFNRQDGSHQVVGEAPKPAKQQTPLGEAGLKTLIEQETRASGTDWFNKEAEKIIDDLSSGKLNLGVFAQWIKNPLDVALGVNSEQREALARFEQFKQLATNEQLLRAKGVQTEGDAVRALQQFFASGAQYSNPTAQQALEKLIAQGRNDLENVGRTFDAYGKMYGDDNPVIQHYRKLHGDRMQRYAPNKQDMRKKYGLE